MKNSSSVIGEMTVNFLFEHFATLATAPDGITRLRELILQLAVQGKLGTQDAGDEPASVLLEKIKKEKERSEKDEEIKKEKAIAPKGVLIYPLPKNWISSPLGAIISFEYGESLPRIKRVDSGKVPVYGSNGIVGYHSKAITKGPALIIGRKGSAGAIQISNIPCHPIDTAYFIDNFKNLDCKFIFYLLTSLNLGSLDKSTAIPGLNRNDAYNLLIGLPPLAEQHRIVAKVDRLMALCDELEGRQQKERAGCLKLGTASLAGLQNADSPEEFERQWAQVCDAFDLILDCPENVAVLRQTILQLAVQGRLVRKEPGDDKAEKLVEKIRKKPFEPIRNDEKQYPIPDFWTWIRLGEAIESMANGIYKPGVFYSDDGIACLRMYNINSGKINFKNLKRMVLDDQEIHQYLLKQGDLLVNRVNSRELVGKAAAIPKLTESVIFESKNIRVRFNTDILLPGFVNILFQTKEVWQVWQGKAKQTCGQASVSQPQIAGICTPLPPLAEQHRIVAKVDALMALCDALESRLKERAAVQGLLAGAVVKQVAGGA
jgi:type I restriction enzyme, S subunit